MERIENWPSDYFYWVPTGTVRLDSFQLSKGKFCTKFVTNNPICIERIIYCILLTSLTDLQWFSMSIFVIGLKGVAINDGLVSGDRVRLVHKWWGLLPFTVKQQVILKIFSLVFVNRMTLYFCSFFVFLIKILLRISSELGHFFFSGSRVCFLISPNFPSVSLRGNKTEVWLGGFVGSLFFSPAAHWLITRTQWRWSAHREEASRFSLGGRETVAFFLFATLQLLVLFLLSPPRRRYRRSQLANDEPPSLENSRQVKRRPGTPFSIELL